MVSDGRFIESFSSPGGMGTPSGGAPGSPQVLPGNPSVRILPGTFALYFRESFSTGRETMNLLEKIGNKPMIDVTVCRVLKILIRRENSPEK